MMEREGKKTLATELRYQVWVQSKVISPDGEGGQIETWKNVRQFFAAIDPIQARQQFAYKSISVEATHLIKVRGGSAILETDRIEWSGRTFEILTIENIQERSIVKVITCKERRP
jgi:SPP1 family predicted phage head-tail adaptor